MGGVIRNVNISGVLARCTGGGVIAGDRTGAISDISLSDIKYEISPTSKLFGNGLPDPIIEYWIQHFAPYYLYIRHVDNIKIHGVKAIWGEADIDDIYEIADPANRPSWSEKGWREDMNPKTSWPFMQVYDVNGLDILGLNCCPFGEESVAVELIEVSNALVLGCHIRLGMDKAFSMEGCKNIQFFGNDFMLESEKENK